MSTTAYSRQEIHNAQEAAARDPVIQEITRIMSRMYDSVPYGVTVFLNGQISIVLSPVSQEVVTLMRARLKEHILANYPALGHIYEPIEVNADRHWTFSPDIPDAVGEYLVNTETDYCVKGIFYGKDAWEVDGEKVTVLSWQPMLVPPNMNRYRQQS